MGDKSSPNAGNGNNRHHNSGGGGWQACFGSNYDAVALYRITLGIMLCIELISRFQYLHPFYSDEGWVLLLGAWSIVWFLWIYISRNFACAVANHISLIFDDLLYNRTLPLRLLLPKSDSIYKVTCLHCYSGSMFYLQTLLSVQVILSIMLIVGYKTKLASIGSWYMYLSLTLRNTWLNFILDRWELI